MAAFLHTCVAVAVVGPCDIYGAAGNPCVAAHSLVRALYGNYSGPLYSLVRPSDNTTTIIKPLAPGGLADSKAHDTFCGANASACLIGRIFDQSPRLNHLDPAPPGGAARHVDTPVFASKAGIYIDGHLVYGAYFDPGNGYRNDNTSGIAKGDEAESMYAVMDGQHYNNGCCFDYGNAETDNLDDGKATMEAIYWGTSTSTNRGGGSGPWVMADLEQGLWAGNNHVQEENPSMGGLDFILAMVKGKAGQFALKGGDATAKDGLKTLYEGPRPHQYEVMKKQGAIILGIGGDNSDRAQGTFYEGVMVSGYTTDATDAAVHANIVAAGYHNGIKVNHYHNANLATK